MTDDENQTSVHVSVEAPTTPSSDDTSDALMLALSAMGVRLESIQSELASVREFMARIELDEAEETEAIEELDETVDELVESDAEVHDELQSESESDSETETGEAEEAASDVDEFIPPETVRESEIESESDESEQEQSPRSEHFWWRRIG